MPNWVQQHDHNCNIEYALCIFTSTDPYLPRTCSPILSLPTSLSFSVYVCMLVCVWCTFHFIATAKMIQEIIVTQLLYSIEVRWIPPIFKPLYLELRTSCRLSCSDRIYFMNETLIPPFHTWTTISDLRPNTVCTVRLKALYNPASIDSGMTKIVRTLSTSKSWIPYTNLVFPFGIDILSCTLSCYQERATTCIWLSIVICITIIIM